jgi:hypothetical protein
MKVGDLPEDRHPGLDIRQRLEAAYDDAQFKVRMWPGGMKFKHTLWWSEKKATHRYSAAYYMNLDPWRGPALFAGITVEKGFEDREVAERRAQQLKEPVDQLLLGKTWDWHGALKSLPTLGLALQDASRLLERELYCWVEFGKEEADSRYFVVRPDALYERGKFKPIRWSEVSDFASQPRKRKWGTLSVVRAFALNECTPELDVSAVMNAFQALREVRDIWRGLVPATEAAKQGDPTQRGTGQRTA